MNQRSATHTRRIVASESPSSAALITVGIDEEIWLQWTELAKLLLVHYECNVAENSVEQCDRLAKCRNVGTLRSFLLKEEFAFRARTLGRKRAPLLRGQALLAFLEALLLPIAAIKVGSEASAVHEIDPQGVDLADLPSGDGILGSDLVITHPEDIETATAFRLGEHLAELERELARRPHGPKWSAEVAKAVASLHGLIDRAFATSDPSPYVSFEALNAATAAFEAVGMPEGRATVRTIRVYAAVVLEIAGFYNREVRDPECHDVDGARFERMSKVRQRAHQDNDLDDTEAGGLGFT